MRSNRAVSFRALSVLALAVVGVVLVAGISPGATRFLTKKKALNLFYTKAQADPRYINVDEMAANANLLDGQDSTAFLGANAKAADAEMLDGQNSTAFLGANAKAADSDLLDGQNSTSFMAGPGKVIKAARNIDNGFTVDVFGEPGLFAVQYQCPLNNSDNGAVFFHALGPGSSDVFMDDGSANPSYSSVSQGNFIAPQAAATGEFITFQINSPGSIATVHVMSVHPAFGCWVRAQAVISS